MKRKNCDIIVLISGNGSNLQAIIDHTTKTNIKAVISNKADAFGLTRARRAQIPTELIQPSDYADRATFDQALLSTCDHYQPDLIVLAGFMHILSPEFVEHFATRIVNIHPSLLPKYPGLHTHQRVLDANDDSHGVSIHYVNSVLDGGPLIAQAALKVHPTDTPDSLQIRIHELEHTMYPQTIDYIGHQILNSARLAGQFELTEFQTQKR